MAKKIWRSQFLNDDIVWGLAIAWLVQTMREQYLFYCSLWKPTKLLDRFLNLELLLKYQDEISIIKSHCKCFVSGRLNPSKLLKYFDEHEFWVFSCFPTRNCQIGSALCMDLHRFLNLELLLKYQDEISIIKSHCKCFVSGRLNPSKLLKYFDEHEFWVFSCFPTRNCQIGSALCMNLFLKTFYGIFVPN